MPVLCCGTGSTNGVPPNAYDSGAIDSKLLFGTEGTESEIVNKQGLRLKAYFWPAPNAKGVILFVHGHGSHAMFELLKSRGPGKPPVYEGSWVQRFNAAGLSVCGIDNQGCGRSDALRGKRFFVNSFSDYVSDVLQFARSIDDATTPGFKGLPIFVAGSSLGGCIAYHAALQGKDLFRGAVLLAPMLSLETVSKKGCNPYLRPLASLASKVCPTAELAATSLKELPFKGLLEELGGDPLLIGTKRKTRVRNAHEYLVATTKCMAGLEAATFPFLVAQSERDTMCDFEGARQLHERAKSADKQLLRVPDMWHILLKEPGNEELQAEVINWVLARV